MREEQASRVTHALENSYRVGLIHGTAITVITAVVICATIALFCIFRHA
jgi:hypothetical protein